MTKFSVHFQVVMDCTEYIEGDDLYDVYDRVTEQGELEQIPLDQIAEVEFMQYKVWSVGRNEYGITEWIGTDKEK